MTQCSICKEFFNQSSLAEVVEHMHNNFSLDKDYYGKEIKKDNENSNTRNYTRNN